MEPQQVRSQVARLFHRPTLRTTRVGVEHELLTADSDTGAVVPIGRILQATRHASYAAHLAFEPGGQVELSLPCAATPELLVHQLRAETAALRADCAAAGVRLQATSVDPRHATVVPLQLTSPRYVAMQRHFDTVGTAGRRMMRRTASTQVCLDWWPGAVGLAQWRLLNVAGPFLAAVFARSTGPDSRLATWLAVDPSRTAFDQRLVRGCDPVAAYADFAAGAQVFTTPGDVAEHLTTLFPPVRPRGRYLEVRFLDVQPLRAVPTLIAVLSALLYDEGCRDRAESLVAGESSRLEELWRRSADGDPEIEARGHELVALGRASGLDAGLDVGLDGAA
jgi:gamma-glutamylcysteine synthetase